MRSACTFGGNRNQPLIGPQMVKVEQPRTGAEPCVGLLQRQDVRAKL